MSNLDKEIEKSKKWTIRTLLGKAAKDLQKAIRVEASFLNSQLCVVGGEVVSVATGYGECACVTCGAVHHYKNMHAGHFIGSRRASIVLEEVGIHPQCVRCNAFMSGMPEAYRVYMLHVYGQDVIDHLQFLKNSVSKQWTREELCAKRIEYRRRINAALKGSNYRWN